MTENPWPRISGRYRSRDEQTAYIMDKRREVALLEALYAAPAYGETR